MRDPKTVGELRECCRVIESTECWEFLKEDGSALSPNTVPTLGRPPVQVAKIALYLARVGIPKGWYIRRRSTCIRFCCNPNHLSVRSSKEGERKGRASNNPNGTPAALVPNGGRQKGERRPEQSKRMIGNTLASKTYAGEGLAENAEDSSDEWELLRKERTRKEARAEVLAERKKQRRARI